MKNEWKRGTKYTITPTALSITENISSLNINIKEPKQIHPRDMNIKSPFLWKFIIFSQLCYYFHNIFTYDIIFPIHGHQWAAVN